MRKNLLVVSLVVLFVSFAAVSFAEVGFQFKIPFQVTGDSDLKDVSGTSTLLTFEIDPSTTVGVLNEQIDFTDDSIAGGMAGSYNVTALRIIKAVADPVYVGLDLGSASGDIVSKNIADVLGGVKLLSSKGKVNSFLNVELLYRFMKTDSTLAGSTLDDFGGAQLSFGAGINF